MDLEQIKALKKETRGTLLDLISITYKDNKERINWIEFLKSAVFTYKYPFAEQLQIYEQSKNSDIKPRALTTITMWDKFGYKLKDSESKPISIIDLGSTDAIDNPKQLYDISQLERKDGKDKEIPFELWDKNITPDKAERLKSVLIKKYDLDSSEINKSSFSTVLSLCLESKFERILDENQDKFAVGENINERTYGNICFTAFISAQIMLMARLGSKTGMTNEEATSFYKLIEVYLPQINTKDTITALGEMTNIFAKEMFAEIEIEVKKIKRELKIASKGELNHEQISLNDMGKNAAGISTGVQSDRVSKTFSSRKTSAPLHRNTEPNASVYRENEKPNIDTSNRYGTNARQSSKSDRMGAGNEFHRADSERNSNQGNNREPVSESNDKKVMIATFDTYNADKYGRPWASAVSRGRNYFQTKEGNPIGEYTGSTDNGNGGNLYVISPQNGRIYGYGQRNKEDKSKSLISYAKYQDDSFLACDKNGNLLAANNVITAEENSTQEELQIDIETAIEEIEATKPTIEKNVSYKSEWEIYLEKRSSSIFAEEYKEPIVLIEFSENPHFGIENSLESQEYEELTFTEADQKFKKVEAEARAERIRQGKSGGYHKTFGAILYKDNPEDTRLSTYEFRYDICDYDENESGLFKHIKRFWTYQEQAMQKGEFTGYKQEQIDNVKRMLSILEPYSEQSRQSQPNKSPDETALHQETRSVGEKVLIPFLYNNGGLIRDNTRSYATIEEPIGKYQIYSHEIGTDHKLKYASIMTASGKLIDIGRFNYLFENEVVTNRYKPDIEQEIDNFISQLKDSFEQSIKTPDEWVEYEAAALLNRIDEAIKHDDGSNLDALIISLKNLINDVYAKDISQKIISALRTKQENGDYIGGSPLYGYKKSQADYCKLVIDDEVAHIVRDIFAWKADGMGDTLIARKLNELGVPSPMKRRVEKGDVKSTGRTKLFIWRDKTIQMITTNPMYIGHMTQGKQKQALCDNTPAKLQPKSEWIIVENTHEAIVDKATFDKAQEMRARNTKDFYRNYDKSKHIRTEKHLFKGILVCASCGSKLVRQKISHNSDTYRFICPIQYKKLSTGCSLKGIKESQVLDITLSAIKAQIETAVDLSAIIERLNKSSDRSNRKNDIATQMSVLQNEIKRLTNRKAELFESHKDKLLSEDEYIYSKQKYTKKIDEAKLGLEHLQEESVLQSETLTPQNKWLQAFRQYQEYDELTFEMVNMLISHVVVHTENELDYVWNFKSDYDVLNEYVTTLGVL